MEISCDFEKGIINKNDVKSRIFEIIKNSDIDISKDFFDENWDDFLDLMEGRSLDFFYGNKASLCNLFRSFVLKLEIKKEIKKNIISEYFKMSIWCCLNEFLDVNGENLWNRATLSKFRSKNWSGEYLLTRIGVGIPIGEKEIRNMLLSFFDEKEIEVLLKHYQSGSISKKRKIVGQIEVRTHTIDVDEKDKNGNFLYRRLEEEIKYSDAVEMEGVWFKYSGILTGFAVDDPSRTFGKGDIFLKKAENEKLTVWVRKDSFYKIIDGKIVKRKGADIAVE